MNTTHAGKAAALMRSALVWDNHTCLPLRPKDTSFLPQLQRVRDTGIDAVTVNIGMDLTTRAEHLAMLESFERWVSAHQDEYVVVHNFTEIEAAREAGKLAIAFDLEGMALLDDDIELIEKLRSRGALWMLVAYNRNNRAGGGCIDEDHGLTDHGKRILAEMKRVGMVVCCSHTGHRTAMSILEAAENPIIFSHSNASAVHEHVRNIPDDLIRACADTGGVVGINGVGDFLGEGVDYADLITRHIDHIVSLVGPDHVGISLDYVYDEKEVLDFIAKMRDSFGEQMASQFTNRFAPPESFPLIVERLLAMGYSSENVEKIIGGNWARVAQQVWR